MLLIAASLLVALQDEDEKPYQPKHKIDVTLSLAEKDGVWRFSVKGTTDLPDDVLMRARVYALEEVDDFKGGKRIDEEGLSSRMDRVYHEWTLKAGKFEETVFESRRRPYSLAYRARVFYDPEKQDAAMAKKVGEEKEFSFHGDLRRGAEADLDRELKETLKELSAELDVVHTLFREFKAAFMEQQKKYDEKAWKKWSTLWLERVRDVRERNEERWLLWAVWLERQGRFRIEGFCDRFDRMAEECTAALKGDEDALASLQRGFEYFLVYFDEAREVMGIDTPFDPETLGAQLVPYAEAFKRLREIVEANDRASWDKDSEGLRGRARSALLALGSAKLIPRRGYERVLALSDAFLKFVDESEKAMAGKGNGGRLKELLKDHDGRLRDFREYAGIK